MANIRKFLECSIEHVPADWRIRVLSSGGFIHTQELDSTNYAVMPDSMKAIITHARDLDCDYILFDYDAPQLEGFEVFEG